MHYSYSAHKACQTVYCMFMCAFTPSVLQQTFSFWTHFLAIVFIFELTYVAAVSQHWKKWGGTLCSSVFWDSLFLWALERECTDGSVLMHKVILALLLVSFLSFSVLQGPLGLIEPPQPLRTEQGFNLTSIQLHSMNEWRNIHMIYSNSVVN